LNKALLREPPSVQERWFARLYFLKPVVFAALSLFWILTGVVSLSAGYDIGVGLMREGGGGAWSATSVIAGAFTDIVIGALMAFRRTARVALLAGIAVTLFYAITGTLLLPRLWADPLAPLLKVLPILALNLVALSILEDR
jgi:hypothetical protein